MSSLPFLSLFVSFRVVGLSLLLVAFAPFASADSAIMAAAEELLQQVKPENSSYKHREPEVRWSADPASPAFCHTDCSGLIIALLEHCYPQRFDGAAFERWLGSRRPTVRRFYDAIADERGFRPVGKITDAQRGDVIAVKYPVGEESTGHIMLVAEKPVRAEAAKPPLTEGTEQWLVTVVDASKSGHGPTDTRRTADGKYHGGLGRGIIRIYARADGTPSGYAWSTFANSTFYSSAERALVIGRFAPNFQP